MISTPDRQTAIALINDAVIAGARRAKACSELEISERTMRRWTKDGEVRADQRPLVPRPEPANALSATERAAILDVCNSGWSGKTRNWQPAGPVWLNPENETSAPEIRDAA